MRAVLPCVIVAALGVAVAPLSAQQDTSADVLLQRTVAVRAGALLTVDVPDADITVLTEARDSASVTVTVRAHDMDWGREVFRRMAFQVEPLSGGVSVRARSPQIDRSEWRHHRDVSVTVRIRVPPTFDLDVHTADGDVSLGDVDGRVLVETSDGDVTAGILRGAAIDLRSADGDIIARSLEAPDIRVRTNDGDVIVDALTGAVRATSGDGDIRLRVIRADAVSLRTGDGDITVEVPTSFSAELDLEGEDVRVDRGLVLQGRISDRRAVGRLGAGGPRVDASTGDGSIRLLAYR